MAGSGDIERARFFFYILIFISIKIPVLLQSIFSTSPSEKHGTYSIYILQWTQVTVTLSSVCIYALQSIVLYSWVGRICPISGPHAVMMTKHWLHLLPGLSFSVLAPHQGNPWNNEVYYSRLLLWFVYLLRGALGPSDLFGAPGPYVSFKVTIKNVKNRQKICFFKSIFWFHPEILARIQNHIWIVFCPRLSKMVIKIVLHKQKTEQWSFEVNLQNGQKIWKSKFLFMSVHRISMWTVFHKSRLYISICQPRLHDYFAQLRFNWNSLHYNF